jgi:signal transduction histidine kinase
VLFFTLTGEYVGADESWKTPTSVIALLGLLALDRLDYRLYGERPPAKAGLLLFALRLLHAAVVGALISAELSMYIFACLPFIATYYFGTRGTLFAALTSWLILAVLTALDLLPTLPQVNVVRGDSVYSYPMINSFAVREYIGILGMATLVLVFGAGAARVAHLERESRRHVERLLARLEVSNAQLRERSEEALAATEDRNRAARDIHDRVGHYLAEVSVQLDKARALGSRNLESAQQAVADAKQSVSQALQDIRSSVAALRSYKRDLTEPTAAQNASDMDLVARVDEGNSARRARQPRYGWLRWIAPRPFDVVTTALYLFIFIGNLADGYGTSGFWEHFAVGVLTLSLILTDRLEYLFFGDRPPITAGIFLLALRLAAWGVFFLGFGLWYVNMLIILVPHFCFVYFGVRAGYVAGVLVGLVIFVLGSGLQLGEGSAQAIGTFLISSLAPLLTICFMLTIIFATSHIVVRERDARTHSLRLLADLDRAGEELAERTEQAVAAVNARNSLARDIHDGLGHYLTAMGVQLEKALAFRQIDPAAADQAILDSRRLASEALREIRGTVGTLSEPQEAASLVSSLSELAQGLRESGLTLDLVMEGSEADYSAQSIMALYRVAQEGITNIRKHSGAQAVSLHLWLGERAAHLEIADDGRGFDLATVREQAKERERGYGLKSMEERLELVGGSLTVESAPGKGTRLHISVPSELTIQDRLASPQAAACV